MCRRSVDFVKACSVLKNNIAHISMLMYKVYSANSMHASHEHIQDRCSQKRKSDLSLHLYQRVSYLV